MKQMPRFDVAQRGDALELLQSLPDCNAAVVVFDPQHRSVLDHLKFGNEGARQIGRAGLLAMSESYIDHCIREAARVLIPSGYVVLWSDTFRVCEGAHLRVADAIKCVDMIAWDSLRMGMGKRSRRRGDYVLPLQRLPITANTWCHHGIPSRWAERVDRAHHPHMKPAGLLARLIGAVTSPGDLVVDPAAGSFITLEIAQRMGRRFIGCDLAWDEHQLRSNAMRAKPLVAGSLLTQAYSPEIEQQIRMTYPGQAHFANTGPFGRSCGECAFLGLYKQKRDSAGNIIKTSRVQACAKYRELTGEQGPNVPASASACKYFESKPT